MRQQPPTNRPRKSKRDRMILDHVVRHRMTTNEVVHRLYFPHHKDNAVTKVTARLCRERLLCKFVLCYPRAYFTLGDQAVQNLGVSPGRTCPLGPQSLPTEYAVLAYALLGSSRHVRLTVAELQTFCPWLPAEFLDFPHCLDESGASPVVELIRVDLGGKPDHLARKCDADVQVRRRNGEFENLVRQGRFRLVVITGTAQKAAAIEAALNQHVWPDGLQFHLAVVPDLVLLIASTNDGP